MAFLLADVQQFHLLMPPLQVKMMQETENNRFLLPLLLLTDFPQLVSVNDYLTSLVCVVVCLNALKALPKQCTVISESSFSSLSPEEPPPLSRQNTRDAKA